MSKFTLLILTHNRLEAVMDCFDSLASTLARDDVQTVVLDNASTDGTWDYLSTLERVTRVQFPENLGVAGGRERLLTLATGYFIGFLDSDVVVGDGWLDRHSQILDTMPNVGLVGVGGSMVLPDWAGFTAAARQDSEVDCVSGYDQLFRRELLDYGLHIDAAAFPHFWGEDSDFCFQVRALGFDIWCVSAPVMHYPAHSGYGANMALLDAHMRALRERWRGKGLVKMEGAY